ncbi:MAG: 5-(carboxyamino)imidazole ribonucleotide synthase [Gammaproteobacteria bacterium]
MTTSPVGAPGPHEGVRVVGIAGGGQLAQMMLPAARRLGLELVVLDPEPQCSAAGEAAHVVVGAFDSLDALRDLASRSDVVTFEIERISTSALRALEAEGHCVRPAAAVLEVIQDKLVQKQFLERHGIPTSAFVACELPGVLPWALPCVWKARRDGYDGRGVAVLRETDDVARLPVGPAMLERLVDIDYELAVMIARDADGHVVPYPLTEILMDPQAHVMDTVVAPAIAPAAIAARCARLAEAVVTALDYVGILAIEFFVDRHGEVLVNEISPRPHNSGHYTIEACQTSQFEQHLRAVSGRPLGSATLLRPAVTFNVLGAPGAQGTPRYVGFDAFAGDDDVHVHCYDKPQVRPGRKMAHVTVLGATREAALARAAQVRGQVRVEGYDD